MVKKGGLKKHIRYFKNISEKELLITNLILGTLVFLIIGFFNIAYSIIFGFTAIFIYLILTNRKGLLRHLIASFTIAIIWSIIAKNQYGYNHNFLTIFGINTYPLFAWATGLFWVYVLYAFIEGHLKEKGYLKKITLFGAIYLPLLIIAETLGYYLFNIQNIPTSVYSGLPLCNCMHAPLWMQISYFLMGFIFFTICYLLKFEKKKDILN